METEDASKVAKETVYGNKSGSVHKVQHFKKQVDEHSVLNSKLKSKGQKKSDFAKGVCPRCGNTEHVAKDCPHIKSTCMPFLPEDGTPSISMPKEEKGG